MANLRPVAGVTTHRLLLSMVPAHDAVVGAALFRVALGVVALQARRDLVDDQAVAIEQAARQFTRDRQNRSSFVVNSSCVPAVTYNHRECNVSQSDQASRCPDTGPRVHSSNSRGLVLEHTAPQQLIPHRKARKARLEVAPLLPHPPPSL